MNIPQPLQNYFDIIMSYIINKYQVPGHDWKQSAYTEKSKKSNQQVWYEHAKVLLDKNTEFCIELNYEPVFGVRCAYGIRKDKPNKTKDNNSWVDAFKSHFPNFNEGFDKKNPEKNLDTDHWLVWDFLKFPKNTFALNGNQNTGNYASNGVQADNTFREDREKKELDILIENISKLFQDSNDKNIGF